MRADLDAGIQERDRVRDGPHRSAGAGGLFFRQIPAQEAGEYPICLVKKNEMLYSERDLYVFTVKAFVPLEQKRSRDIRRAYTCSRTRGCVLDSVCS